MTLSNNLATFLRKYRAEQGITQEALADLVGNRRKNIIQWEQGNPVGIGLTELEEISIRIGVPLDEVLGLSKKADNGGTGLIGMAGQIAQHSVQSAIEIIRKLPEAAIIQPLFTSQDKRTLESLSAAEYSAVETVLRQVEYFRTRPRGPFKGSSKDSDTR